MNEHLKFSWGHIIAFLTLIFVGYLTFVGWTYHENGDFTKAGITTFVVVFSLMVVFIGIQMAKATAHKFKRWIWVERIGLVLSPFIFIVLMIPYFHFCSIYERNDEIVNSFKDAINASKQMFVDYDSYAEHRISNYEYMLSDVIANKENQPKRFLACGFVKGKEYVQKENMVRTLQLQLLSENYSSLKNEAITWIDNSCEGASTLNVFLIGNINEISTAIHDWNKQLENYSENKLSNENPEAKGFEESSNSLETMDEKIAYISNIFSDSKFPNMISIIIASIAFCALLFPYILQDRYTKSTYTLLRNRRGVKSNLEVIQEERGMQSKASSNIDKVSNDYDSFTLN